MQNTVLQTSYPSSLVKLRKPVPIQKSAKSEGTGCPIPVGLQRSQVTVVRQPAMAISEKMEMKKRISAGGYLALGTFTRKMMLKMAKTAAMGPSVNTMICWYSTSLNMFLHSNNRYLSESLQVIATQEGFGSIAAINYYYCCQMPQFDSLFSDSYNPSNYYEDLRQINYHFIITFVLYMTLSISSAFLLLSLVLLASSVKLYGNFIQFKEYQQQFQKKYQTTQQEMYRFMIYLQNLKTIERLNRQDQATGVYGLTQFTDMTRTEMFSYTGIQMPQKVREEHQNYLNKRATQKAHIPKNNVPDAWDWTQQGAVTGIKNQGSCGSCWSFSTAGNIQGQYFLKNKELLDFSPQQMIDCDVDNFGCNGGWPYNALDFLSINGGLQTLRSYPLRNNTVGPCEFNPSLATALVQKYQNITKDEVAIKQAVYEIGPLSILLDFEGMFHYKSGVASPLLCGSWPNHALVLVGYGVKGEDYWLIKNSWGPKWGINGYFMLKRGKQKCGVDQWAVTGVLKN